MAVWPAIVTNDDEASYREFAFKPRRPVSYGRSLESRYPELAAELHPALNGDLAAADLSPGLAVKVWWRCPRGHEWQASVSARVSGTGCPTCDRDRPIHGRTLAEMYPELASELHPDRNGDVDAARLAVGSNRVVWWTCRHGHEWPARVFVRTRGSGCPICARRRVDVTRSLAYRYPGLAEELDAERNAGIDPFAVAAGSNRMVWWRCGCGHEWQARISDRTRGTGCPRCSRERRREKRGRQ